MIYNRAISAKSPSHETLGLQHNMAFRGIDKHPVLEDRRSSKKAARSDKAMRARNKRRPSMQRQHAAPVGGKDGRLLSERGVAGGLQDAMIRSPDSRDVRAVPAAWEGQSRGLRARHGGSSTLRGRPLVGVGDDRRRQRETGPDRGRCCGCYTRAIRNGIFIVVYGRRGWSGGLLGV